MKGVAEVHQICQSGNGLCLIVIFLMHLLPTRPTVAHSVRSSADPALAGTRGSDISENAGGREPAIGVANRSEFPVWKTITVGVYKNVSAMREALDAAPCRIHVGSWADEILDRPEFPYVEAALARLRLGLRRRRQHQGISENVDQHHDMRRLWVCPRCRVWGLPI
jgi:hypothetical protein